MRLLLFLYFGLYTITTQAQYRFEHLNVSDGLSQNSVNDIYQDQDGFVWLATQDGLNRYDGYDFVKYMEDGEVPVSHNFLWSIVEDQLGNIWTASSSGATRLNWRDGKSTHFFLAEEEKFEGEKNQVHRLLILDEQMLLLFGKKVFQIDFNAFEDEQQIVLSDEFLLNEKKIQNQWVFNAISMGSEKYYILHDKIYSSKDSISFPEGFTTSNFKSEVLKWREGFFLGTQKGLLYFDISANKFETIPCVDQAVNDLIWGPDKKDIWVGTDNGIFILNPTNFECLDYIASGENEYNLSGNTVAALYLTKDNILMAGTANGGVNCYDIKKDRFKYLQKAHGFTDKPVWSVCQTNDYLLVGSDNGLYFAQINSSLTNKLFASSAIERVSKVQLPQLQNKRITAINHYGGSKFLIGTYDEKIILLDVESNTSRVLSLNQGIGHPQIVTAIITQPNAIWVTTQNGLFKFSKKLDHYQFYSYYEDPVSFPSNYYLSAYASQDGTLWLGSNFGFQSINSDGSTMYEHDQKNPDQGPAFNFVSGFFEDTSGRIWMSTFGGGVSCFNREKNSFFHLNKSNGLISNICSSIEGNDTHVFVSSNGGISRIDLETMEIVNYTTSDGLTNNEFAIASSYRFNDDFVFGNVNGIIAFNPKELKEPQDQAAPTITNIIANYESSPYSRIQSGLAINPGEKIFSLEFSDMGMKEADQLSYQYKMDGFNESWVTTDPSNRRATYSLPPGDYLFKVKAIRKNIESDIKTLEVIVHPAFYQTWWFFLLVGIFTIVTITLVSRYYSHQQLKEKLRKLEVQQKIQWERERISRDLHDNVGSQITYIATSINNLSDQESSEELKELGDFTRDTMRQLRETIWAINHDEVSLEELKTKVVDYLSEILRPHAQITHEVHFPKSDKKLNPTRAINIFRIIQEAINNTVKHAQATKITIQLELGTDPMIEIRDNGIGFDGKDKNGHFGLMNMRSRAHEIDGELKLKSEVNNGTIITIRGFEIGQMT